MTQEQTADTLSRTRGALKPAEIMQLQQEQKAIDVFERTEDVAESFYQTLVGLNFSLVQTLTIVVLSRVNHFLPCMT